MTNKKKVTGGKRPQNLRRTLGQFSAYLGRHRIIIGLVALLAAISALAALFGTYMIRPVVNGLLENGSKAYLAGAVGFTACIYIVGALSTLGYTQLMVRAGAADNAHRGPGLDVQCDVRQRVFLRRSVILKADIFKVDLSVRHSLHRFGSIGKVGLLSQHFADAAGAGQ